MKSVSVVIPAKDEEATIERVLKDLNKTIRGLKNYRFEVIVIDDNSSDKTGQIAKKYGALVIRNNGVCGKGNALKLGFKKAKGDIIVMMDADYSHSPEDIPRFLQEIEKGAGFVIGSRCLGGSDEYTHIRSFGNVFLTMIFKVLMRKNLTDALNGYKAFKKDVVKKYAYKSRTFEIEIELIANALKEGMNIVEISSHERARAGGKMKSNVIVHGPKFLWAIIKEGIKYNIHAITKGAR